MKNQELFDKTVGILVKAYLDGTLVATDGCGCGVGNLIAANNGYDIQNNQDGLFWVKNGKVIPQNWVEVFCTYQNSFFDKIFGTFSNYFKPERITSKQTSEFKKTGYSVVELSALEYAFETQSKANNKYVFNGLMGMVDQLANIHKANNYEIKQAKELFTLTEAG